MNYRTNNALIQTLGANNLNGLTNVTRTGTLTVAGTTTSTATNVTVNTTSATLYSDKTFAATNFALANGNNTFSAIAQDNYNRKDTNTVSINLPSTVSYIYDLNGNLTSDGTRGMDYDDENQLIRVTVTNAWKSEFVYDGKFRRRMRKEFAWQNSSWVSTSEVHYIYDGNVVIQERDANNLPTLTLTRTGGRLLARSDNLRLAIGDSSAHAYFHTDGNGNVTALVSGQQIVVAKYFYDPFGNILSKAGALAEANNYRFASQELHANSGLIYFGRRFYEPNLQRFLNRDPIAEFGGVNLFAYVGNNPINLIDFYGFGPCPPSFWDSFWDNVYNNWDQNVLDYFAGIGQGALGLAEMGSNFDQDPFGFAYNSVAGNASQLGTASADPWGYAGNAWNGFLNTALTSKGIGNFTFGVEATLAGGVFASEAGAAADSALIGVTSGESSALARQIYGIEVNGQPAVSSIEAFGSRAGSTFRGRGPLPTSDLDIIVTLNESAANPAGLSTVNSQLGEIGSMFQGAKGFPVNPIVEIPGLPSVKPNLLQTPFIPLKP